ncbi:hypothetical protein [Shewanella cutis]|uniref:XRE family transcriptional regulator n=1 Tax=Shewanella cutis TaxID=2766780 RepID=A0ABS9QW63_9GAMM|nr:hypothetical protein [Shewanella sp. PS-2]MCG9964597.1 hypothetical protein [Shewanella sp. PS-2]
MTDFKEQLKKMLEKPGELNAFCVKHDLSFNYVYRVAKGIIPEPSFSKATAIQAALNKEGAESVEQAESLAG